MIPKRIYIGSERQQVKDAIKCLDPFKAKSTSALVAEIAKADAAATTAAGPSKKSQKRKGKRKQGDDDERPVLKSSTANSRAELHNKLELRIAELREERRRKQSEADKAKFAQVRAAREKVAAKEEAPTSKKQESAPEIRLSFEPKSASLPFEAGIGRRGQKVKKLRSDLRKREAEGEKLRAAEAAGEGKEVRQDLAMRKALSRAKGEKIHDDLGKLRKAQKSLDLKKKKGKEKWAERKEEFEKYHKEKQQTRKENLAARRGKKQKRAGFEGKRSGYLNSDK